MLVKLDKVSKKPMLLLKADSLLEKLRETENSTNQKLVSLFILLNFF